MLKMSRWLSEYNRKTFKPAINSKKLSERNFDYRKLNKNFVKTMKRNGTSHQIRDNPSAASHASEYKMRQNRK